LTRSSGSTAIAVVVLTLFASFDPTFIYRGF
jgi:hypothetical protein